METRLCHEDFRLSWTALQGLGVLRAKCQRAQVPVEKS